MKLRSLIISMAIIALGVGIFLWMRRTPDEGQPFAAQSTPSAGSVVQPHTTDTNSSSVSQAAPTPLAVAAIPSAPPGVSGGSAPFQPYTAPKPTPNNLEELRKQMSSADWSGWGPPGAITNDAFRQAYDIVNKISEGTFIQWANQYIASRMPGLNRALTDDDIFRLLWPQEYRDGLNKIQDVMVQENVIKAEEKTEFKNEQEIYAFYHQLLRYMHARGAVTDDQMEGFTRGITEILPQTINAERDVLRLALPKKNVLVPGGQRFATSGSMKDLAQDILHGLAEVFSGARSAHAQVPGLPGWVTFPQCYKALAPNPVPGPNLIAFCCNCGISLRTIVPVFLPDCGPFGAACDVPIGCLNMVCGTWPNAIWDGPPPLIGAPPWTGICGCG